MWHRLTFIIRDEKAQGQMEYSLILSFVVIVLIASLTGFAGSLTTLTTNIVQAMGF